jgi:hypothetical protein
MPAAATQASALCVQSFQFDVISLTQEKSNDTLAQTNGNRLRKNERLQQTEQTKQQYSAL